tara:strand:- start:124 stop:1650 length:1527 start_codon:yes stop_codon:yes gene_type:complete
MIKKFLLHSNEVIKVSEGLKKQNKTIALCHGVFDLFHLGHLKYFENAKKNADYLFVSITSDKFVKKGFNRPFYSQNERIKILSSLEIIDHIVLSDEETSQEVIKLVKPNFYIKGPDYKDNTKDTTKNIYKENATAKKFGGKIIYTNDKTLSSGSLINKYFNNLNEKQKKMQEIIKKKYTFEFIKRKIENLKKLKILLIGETIIDEYIFSESIGKSGKEPHLVIRNINSEIYLGGIIAIAKHLESFSKKVSIISTLGHDKKYKNFIEKNLRKNTSSYFLYKKNCPTIIKKRFVDKLTNHKLLGVYSLNDRNLLPSENEKLEKLVTTKASQNDLVIVSDYGHGFIMPNIAKKICRFSNKVFLNAQLNATNIGYHTLNNYNNFNSLIINESELRHEFKDRYSDVKFLIKELSKKIKCNSILVSRGTNGAIFYNSLTKNFFNCPAYANKIIDKVGAGDTLLAIFSICIFAKIPDDLSLFIASLAAASVVENMGNSKNVDKASLLKLIENHLK